MNSADYVANRLEIIKKLDHPLQWVAWQLALLCVGWSYVFGARGELCTPSNRRARYSDENPTIKTKCKNYDGSGSCSGCKWYPSNKRTRFFDCRGFTYWVLLQVFGWKLKGVGATSQWNTAANWKAKGTIDTMPKDTLVCLFQANGKTMEHTGFGYNNETVECQNGVQHFTSRNKKWTHWAVPVVIEGTVTPEPAEPPTLKRGSKGSYVTLLQTKLIQLGYSLPRYGADGDFGAETLAAVKAFQNDAGLTSDGVVGKDTWDALEKPVAKYTVKLEHLSRSVADSLVKQYGGVMTQEGG